MKIYLSAGSSEIALARQYMQRLRALGHSITHDWTAAIARAGGVANPRDASHADRRAWAYADLAGIEAADVFWLLVPTSPSFGASYELAHAVCVSRACRTLVSGDWRQSIFTSLAMHRFDDHDQALQWIRENDWRAIAKRLGNAGI